MNAETPNLTHLQETALKLLENGYIPVPLQPMSKTPAFNGWQTSMPTEESIRRDFRFDRGIGLLQGVAAPDNSFPVAIDIDLDDVPLFECVTNAIGGICPTKRGKKGVTYLLRV